MQFVRIALPNVRLRFTADEQSSNDYVDYTVTGLADDEAICGCYRVDSNRLNIHAMALSDVIAPLRQFLCSILAGSPYYHYDDEVQLLILYRETGQRLIFGRG